MFVLTCPSCESEVRCRYARSGAVASCPTCRAAFRLNEHTLRTEEEREDLFAPWRGGQKAAAGTTVEVVPLAELERVVAVRNQRKRSKGRTRGGRVAIMLGLNVAASAFIVGWVVLVLKWTAGSTPSPAEAARETTLFPEPAAVESPDRAASAEPKGAPLPPVQFTRWAQ